MTEDSRSNCLPRAEGKLSRQTTSGCPVQSVYSYSPTASIGSKITLREMYLGLRNVCSSFASNCSSPLISRSTFFAFASIVSSSPGSFIPAWTIEKLCKREVIEESLQAQDLQNRGIRHASPLVFICIRVGYLLTPSKEMRVLSKSMTLWRRHVMWVPFWGYSLFCTTIKGAGRT